MQSVGWVFMCQLKAGVLASNSLGATDLVDCHCFNIPALAQTLVQGTTLLL
jgi:hypothetical protein